MEFQERVGSQIEFGNQLTWAYGSPWNHENINFRSSRHEPMAHPETTKMGTNFQSSYQHTKKAVVSVCPSCFGRDGTLGCLKRPASKSRNTWFAKSREPINVAPSSGQRDIRDQLPRRLINYLKWKWDWITNRTRIHPYTDESARKNTNFQGEVDKHEGHGTCILTRYSISPCWPKSPWKRQDTFSRISTIPYVRIQDTRKHLI